MHRQEIFSLSLGQLKEYIAKLGLAGFRAKQVRDWLYKKHVWNFAAMTNLSKQDSGQLKEAFKILPANVKILSELVSRDKNTTKLLVRFEDGNTVETVGMVHAYGNSVCVSSQIGCAMGCAFCASTMGGLVRNLTAAEMLTQIALFQQRFHVAGGRVDNVVIMGSGEPLLNYDAVLQFIHLLHDQDVYKLSYRNITISTCGIVPAMKKLAREAIPVSLAVSLHAPNDELRSKLLPVNAKYKIKDVLAAAHEYAQITGRQVTYEYLLLKGVNDSVLCAQQLADLLQGSLSAVNIIPFNSVSEKGWQRPEKKQIEQFASVLHKRKITATIRKEMGADIQAACGQLRAGYKDG